MTKTIKNSYSKYLQKKTTDRQFFSFFRSVMPEIVVRTTKLEGERVSKRFVSSLFLDN